MQAALVTSFDRPPHHGTAEPPDPAPGQVVVDVLASAISPRVRSGAAGRHYSGAGALPMIPGIDAVGRTPEGRLVYVLTLDATRGTMAEQVAVDPAAMIDLPQGLDPVVAAAAAIPGISSWVALRSRVTLQPGQEVLVLGATGVAGRMSVQIAKTLGAGRVVAGGRDPHRLADLATAGADVTVDVTDPDALAAAAADADVVIDYVWGSVSEQAIPAIARARTTAAPLSWISIGSMAGPDLRLPSAALRAVDLRILGSGQGSASPEALLGSLPDLMAAVAAGTVEIATTAVPLADVERAWTAPEQAGRRTVLTP
jgi:NADPH:quinone reductase-like Zn-dependent oxidoreductase